MSKKANTNLSQRYADKMKAAEGASVSDTFQTGKTPVTAFNVKLPTATHKALKLKAVEENTSMNDLLRRALEIAYNFPYDPHP
jgi:hypothetical protein